MIFDDLLAFPQSSAPLHPPSHPPFSSPAPSSSTLGLAHSLFPLPYELESSDSNCEKNLNTYMWIHFHIKEKTF